MHKVCLLPNVVALCIFVKAFMTSEGSVYKNCRYCTCQLCDATKASKGGVCYSNFKERYLLGAMNTAIRGHEFHFSTMEPTIDDFPWAFHLEGRP